MYPSVFIDGVDLLGELGAVLHARAVQAVVLAAVRRRVPIGVSVPSQAGQEFRA